jgi:hypothetical protein
MHIIRRASVADLPRVYELQNVPFREIALMEPLLPLDRFVKEAQERFDAGIQQLFVLDSDGIISGFIVFFKKEHGWEAVGWGRWMNSLAYATFVLAFEKLGFPKLIFAVRLENERFLHLCNKFQFRRTNMELIYYRDYEFGPIKSANLQHFEITPEEYLERAESMGKDSLKLVFE